MIQAVATEVQMQREPCAYKILQEGINIKRW